MHIVPRSFVGLTSPAERRRLALALGTWVLSIGPAAWGQPSADPLERSFHYVEKTSEATELFNSNRPREALAIFQELTASYSDLDEDGYAALSVGDCLAAMGEYDSARRFYTDLTASRPALQAKIADRLLDVELLSGVIGEETLARLRAAAAGGPEGDVLKGRVRLGWALEKKARALLAEAVDAFRSAAQMGWIKGDGGFGRHALLIEEINQDLASLMAQTEALIGARAQPPQQVANDAGNAAHVETGRADFVLRTCDGRRFEWQIRRDAGTGMELQVNGRRIELTEDEKRIIQRHEERIHAILLRSAEREQARR